MTIVYSTEPGKVALDGTGHNSAFTAALLRHIDTQGEKKHLRRDDRCAQ